MSKTKPVALALVAHPDDVEFTMAGTLLLLKEAGAEIHIWNLANGCYGSIRHSKAEIARIRRREAVAAARVGGATAHPPLFDDLSIFYDAPSLARVAAGLRAIRPTILLTHPFIDYMEDHQNAARLAVTAAFSRSIKTYVTRPPRKAWDGPIAVYHALAHGWQAGPGPAPRPTHFVGIQRVLALKRAMLAEHKSQKEWLDASQGMDSYLVQMEKSGRDVGRLSRRFQVAEAYTRHNAVGFSDPAWDPLVEMLGKNVRVQ